MKPLFVCYPKCSTCKKAAMWLGAEGVEVDMRHIVEENPSREELAEWIAKSELPISRFFNTSGMLYREMNLKNKVKTAEADELLDLLATDGMLVKRPILITDKGVFPGFREEEWRKLL
ncbi:MAG: arsenate reductase family protein [Rikenellaceae bacterium]